MLNSARGQVGADPRGEKEVSRVFRSPRVKRARAWGTQLTSASGSDPGRASFSGLSTSGAHGGSVPSGLAAS